MNELTNVLAKMGCAAQRRWRVALFFVAWTVFAIWAAWWLTHLQGAGDAGGRLVINAGGSSQATIGQQIRTWLKLADLNFRGAYPWVLLAPYVVLLAVLFPLERGRLRFNVPVHIAACLLFVAMAARMLSRMESGAVALVVVSNHNEGGPIPWPLFSGNLPFDSGGKLPALPANAQTYTLSRSNFTATTIEIPPGAERGLPPMVLSTNEPAPGGNSLLARNLAVREIVESETNAGTGAATMVKRVVAWSSSWQAGRGPFSLLLDLLAYGSLVGGAHAVHFYRRFREREERALLAESRLATARLHALQAQLHPHFLFNALNAVATLIRHDADAALETLTSFSELLRLALGQSGKQEVPLREDLRFLERYVEIQQVRLGDRFRFEQDVDSAALDCLVPALLLQPLVENALRHGIEPISQPGEVRLTARRESGRLLVTIEDNGAGLGAAPDSPSGIGLSNLRARLNMLYGDNQKLEIGPRPSGGVTVRIELPARS